MRGTQFNFEFTFCRSCVTDALTFIFPYISQNITRSAVPRQPVLISLSFLVEDKRMRRERLVSIKQVGVILVLLKSLFFRFLSCLLRRPSRLLVAVLDT